MSEKLVTGLIHNRLLDNGKAVIVLIVELEIETYLYPGIKDVVLRLNRVDVAAVVKMVDCYHDNRRCIKHLSKIEYLTKESTTQ